MMKVLWTWAWIIWITGIVMGAVHQHGQHDRASREASRQTVGESVTD